MSNHVTAAGADAQPRPGDDPPVLALDDERARDVARTGGKAAALARVHAAGLPALPGVVVPTGADLGGLDAASRLVADVRRHLGDGRLIARSSSPIEDAEDSSMAGRFDSIPGIDDDDALVDAVRRVASSGQRVADEEGIEDAPEVAVLIQPHVEHRVGGVCFGVEPVTGRADRRLVVASSAGPDPVVSGEVTGVRHTIGLDGTLLETDGDDDPAAHLDRERCRELSRLAERCEEVFGGPQDMEFLVATDGTLWLLQSRPVTTEIRGTPRGPLYGAGPVSETFPDPLRPLEADLWVPPLREAMRAALGLAALASSRQLSERPVVVVVDGRVAVDLELTGAEQRHHGWRSRIDPRPWSRRARATWRVGRLKAALPAIGRDLVAESDRTLAEVGPLDELSDQQLVGLLHRCQAALRSLHGHEILMGFLVAPGTSRLTGASVALRALVTGRQHGLDDDELVARSPVVLALTGPRIGPVELPETGPDLPPALPPEATADEPAVVREALRLRLRWTQELMARAVVELSRRLDLRDGASTLDRLLDLDLAEVTAIVAGAAVPRAARPTEERARPAPRLPVRFRLDDQGRPVPVVEGAPGDGTAAGGGRGRGPVALDPDAVEEGSVLVVRDLQPELARLLPRLSGLVAESGSPLAHLAILARESGVATVVALADATNRFEAGQVVEVDGDAGTVEPAEEAS